MPCHDDYPETVKINKIKRILEPLLCEAVDLLEKNELLKTASKKLQAWAKKHEANEKLRIREEALKKLSPKERRALGIK